MKGVGAYSLCCNCVEAHEQDKAAQLLLPGRNAYRTNCRHIICERCASRAFATGCLCPVCSTKLYDGEVYELMIGVPPSDVVTTLFQTAFQNPSWDVILDNTYKAVSAAYELQLFVQNQLLHELVTHKEKYLQQEKGIEQLTEELNNKNLQLKKTESDNSALIKDMEYHIRMRESELCEIKDAYKEKLRKCEAWEKAYISLQHQQEQVMHPGIPSKASGNKPSMPVKNKIPPTASTATIDGPVLLQPASLQKSYSNSSVQEENNGRKIGHHEKVSYSFSTTSVPKNVKFSHLIPTEDNRSKCMLGGLQHKYLSSTMNQTQKGLLHGANYHPEGMGTDVKQDHIKRIDESMKYDRDYSSTFPVDERKPPNREQNAQSSHSFFSSNDESRKSSFFNK